MRVAKHFSTISITPLNRKRLVQQQELLLKVPLLQFWFSFVVPVMNITRTQGPILRMCRIISDSVIAGIDKSLRTRLCLHGAQKSV